MVDTWLQRPGSWLTIRRYMYTTWMNLPSWRERDTVIPLLDSRQTCCNKAPDENKERSR